MADVEMVDGEAEDELDGASSEEDADGMRMDENAEDAQDPSQNNDSQLCEADAIMAVFMEAAESSLAKLRRDPAKLSSHFLDAAASNDQYTDTANLVDNMLSSWKADASYLFTAEDAVKNSDNYSWVALGNLVWAIHVNYPQWPCIVSKIADKMVGPNTKVYVIFVEPDYEHFLGYKKRPVPKLAKNLFRYTPMSRARKEDEQLSSNQSWTSVSIGYANRTMYELSERMAVVYHKNRKRIFVDGQLNTDLLGAMFWLAEIEWRKITGQPDKLSSDIVIRFGSYSKENQSQATKTYQLISEEEHLKILKKYKPTELRKLGETLRLRTWNSTQQRKQLFLAAFLVSSSGPGRKTVNIPDPEPDIDQFKNDLPILQDLSHWRLPAYERQEHRIGRDPDSDEEETSEGYYGYEYIQISNAVRRDSSLVEYSEESQAIVQQRTAYCDKLLTIIKSTQCREYLRMLRDAPVDSGLHSTRTRALASKQMWSLMHQNIRSPSGPIVEDVRVFDLYRAMRVLRQKKDKDSLKFVRACYDVWLPEALIYAIQVVDGVTYEQAEKKYEKGPEFVPEEIEKKWDSTMPSSMADRL